MTAPDPAGRPLPEPGPVCDCGHLSSAHACHQCPCQAFGALRAENAHLRDDLYVAQHYRDALRAEVAALRAELEHARPVVSAARELVEHLPLTIMLVHDADLRVQLSVLAARVAALSDTTETEDETE